jgi:hypothetical protein
MYVVEMQCVFSEVLTECVGPSNKYYEGHLDASRNSYDPNQLPFSDTSTIGIL